jgi:hypothetical protein
MSYTANISYIQDSLVKSHTTSYDFLRPNAFKFSIKDLPRTSFSCQSANIPDLQLGFATQPTPFSDVPTIGDKLNFGEFTIRFIIAEDMSNYIEMYRWLVALGFPDNYKQFQTFTKDRPSRFPFVTKSSGKEEVLAYSDGVLTILDSTNTPKVNIIFKNLFPTSLQALDFDISSATVEYFTAIASFKYTIFEVEPL